MSMGKVSKRVVAGALLVLLAACQSQLEESSFIPLSTTAQLDREWAAKGEGVTVTLTGGNSKGAEVSVAGTPADVTIINANKFEFVVPAAVQAGEQAVAIKLGAQTLLSKLNVLGGDIVAQEYMLVLAPGSDRSDVERILSDLQHSIVDGPRPLGADEGPCSGELVRIRVSSEESGKTLSKLKRLTDGSSLWHSDPLSGYSSGTAGEILPVLDAVGATSARRRGRTGAGAVIAVLDTGVSEHKELGARLLLSEGYDFVDEGTAPLDDYPDGGHGTPVAVLAAGAFSGVAPAAQVLPERVCDGNGSCYTSNVLLGLCHALVTTDRRLAGLDNLVLSISLGGETPVGSIESVLSWATRQGALVAAAAGNKGANGSPAHYPAAYGIDGVAATAALEASSLGALRWDWRPAAFSNRGDYLDISAPGAGLTSGTASGGYASGFTGTSYASALTAGGLAVWQEARPELSSPEIVALVKANARPLGYSESEVGAGMLDLSVQPE